MNYYEHHIGDYDQATAHLTACEDGIYSRMIRLCMASEKPLPADVPWIVRRVRANSREERKAVETILDEFFELQADGYHQHRCDSEIARFHEREPDREAKKENERERQRRSRDRRKQLFDTLRQHGLVPEYDSPMSELHRAVSRMESQLTSQRVTGSVTRDATGTHFPLPTPHTPEKNKRESARGSRLPPDWTPEPEHMAFAEGLGLRNGKASAELEKFRDYWAAQPGQKGVKTDWPATWRNWVRRATENVSKASTTAAVNDFDGVH